MDDDTIPLMKRPKPPRYLLNKKIEDALTAFGDFKLAKNSGLTPGLAR